MEVRNCKSCGRLFNYIGGNNRNLCPACVDKLEDLFQEVKKYVEENPSVSMNEICDQFDVDARQVEKWIREERLCFADDSPIGIACEKCGKMIKTGKYCDICRNDMQNAMGNLYREERKQPQRAKQETKMRFLDK